MNLNIMMGNGEEHTKHTNINVVLILGFLDCWRFDAKRSVISSSDQSWSISSYSSVFPHRLRIYWVCSQCEHWVLTLITCSWMVRWSRAMTSIQCLPDGNMTWPTWDCSTFSRNYIWVNCPQSMRSIGDGGCMSNSIHSRSPTALLRESLSCYFLTGQGMCLRKLIDTWSLYIYCIMHCYSYLSCEYDICSRYLASDLSSCSLIVKTGLPQSWATKICMLTTEYWPSTDWATSTSWGASSSPGHHWARGVCTPEDSRAQMTTWHGSEAIVTFPTGVSESCEHVKDWLRIPMEDGGAQQNERVCRKCSRQQWGNQISYEQQGAVENSRHSLLPRSQQFF